MQGKLFQRCTHLLYCSVLSLGSNVNTRRMLQPDMRSIFHIKNQWNILVIGNYYVNYQNYQNKFFLSSSETRGTLMHLFLFTKSAQRELVSICTQSKRNCINFPCIITLGSPCVHNQISKSFYWINKITFSLVTKLFLFKIVKIILISSPCSIKIETHSAAPDIINISKKIYIW